MVHSCVVVTDSNKIFFPPKMAVNDSSICGVFFKKGLQIKDSDILKLFHVGAACMTYNIKYDHSDQVQITNIITASFQHYSLPNRGMKFLTRRFSPPELLTKRYTREDSTPLIN
jgi:hypothetical protein